MSDAKERLVIRRDEFGLIRRLDGVVYKQIAVVYSTDLDVSIEKAAVYGRLFAKYWNGHSELVAKCDGLTKERDELRKVLSELMFSARTSGGVAGRDEHLVSCCEKAEGVLASEHSPTASAV